MPEVDKQLIEQEFGVPVLSTYQAVEALRIGFQCEHRRGFHLSMDDVAIRVVDDHGNDVEPGGRGHLLISNLTNRATVLLNYRLGDIVTLGESSCSCGRSLPTIERIDGRSDDLITLAGGDPLHALAVLEKLQGVASVVQVQVVQETLGRFLIRAIGTSISARERAAAELVAHLRSVVGHAEVSVDWVEDIPRSSGGKVKAVISNCAA
jgi:phenylacetate-CoA ligase